ncbi:hypothetical protein HGM15179_019908 [Zosterops borbonicus]|uniref:Integrase catalytic domain-containing protein n=1 Tax=Zosterops borbonicus TaxID=364589 RepID=A0A8K1D9Q4_9PASS|nr:hypothetical protein HGM15179_019908 [Zosterops borbonicus]
MVEATTGWLETYPVPHPTAQNTILGLEKQVLRRHGTPERIESNSGTHFKNSLIESWAREHGIGWVFHIPYHAPASGEVEKCNGLLKTTLKALGGGTLKNWEINLAKATWLVDTRGFTNRAVTNLCPSHQQEHCQAALISMYIIILLLFAAPILISSTTDFIKAKWGSKELKPKTRDIVIFLLVLFIVLLTLCNFLQQLRYTLVSSEVFFLLNCIHSSIKPFIYFLAGRCWRPCSLRSLRLSLQRAFDEQKEKTAHSNDAPMDTVI